MRVADGREFVDHVGVAVREEGLDDFPRRGPRRAVIGVEGVGDEIEFVQEPPGPGRIEVRLGVGALGF